MKTSLWFTIPSLLMCALFILSVVLQYNDPDPLVWMLIYGAAALVSALAPYRKEARYAAIAVLAVSIPWLLFLLLQVIGVISFSDLFLKMNEKGGAVEVGREAGGLTIVTAWMLVCALCR